MDLTAVVVALIGAALGGGIVGIVQARAQNRRTTAEAVKVGAEAEVTLGGGWQVLWQSARDDAAAARAESAQGRIETNELRERLAIVEQREQECRDTLARIEHHISPENVEKNVVSLIDREIAKRSGT